MTTSKIAVIVLAAGLGTRMKSKLPKVMHPLAGRPMISHLMETVEGLDPENVCVVVGDFMDSVSEAVSPFPTAVQSERLGTAHAVLAARETIGDFDGDVLVIFGADPLITLSTLEHLLDVRAQDAAVAVLGFRPDDPGLYGRLIVGEDGNLEAIVEAKDATDAQLEIDLCNSGVMSIDGTVLWSLLERVGNDNAKGEYYLTDIIGLARADGLTCVVWEGDPDELIGIDSRADLAEAEAILQDRLRFEAMSDGVTMTDPTTVFLSYDTVIGSDVSIGPNVFFGPGVSVGEGATINAFSHLEGATVNPKASVGPFARLRPGTNLGEGAKVGNFVEIKNAVIEPAAKISHLSYIGDAEVGAGANIGAGTITCNYDGFFKSKTVIGKGAFIGSNTALVAPVTIGEGAVVGAGSTLSKDVDADALGVTRANYRQVDGWAKANRERKSAEKAKKKK
ncbi:MAG: bifunctional UDP-N-acetylglucosamine diphosphorylase/glucosamine-1-phosphate N-acetyltransferase GlmU [Rhodospirillaceae bacterium]|jgi:bifunctional UDP-N-acetylglucosamine pyrophosphorylase / glucosamine-1-phosphate N-acetyltransferase|nr:bifunctional UDP-N-acetylglucosamine diphosphorylase/glucosamine-1-phosphate N-acetyltransferase GlmU [Rhodospirillaceae bacterium]MBT5242642.1 bifunctional UDP-N-acetylglucosamine diphosphorylase/glucosamine-1-phosphate N-acetyltransferase GlmU [Rhodospirillaceae bacterium]MBT5562805.1 bifunctional UDP-N-acetylglucosamine diphosphorylase/glucosamine-1-phosphate N-acetyltransferase GlmU [Rhodospirillaceae bacterium]MBT6241234.1 bifunctional UDP-N-acetylglucosamine diphosphorylase/glucosamine-